MSAGHSVALVLVRRSTGLFEMPPWPAGQRPHNLALQVVVTVDPTRDEKAGRPLEPDQHTAEAIQELASHIISHGAASPNADVPPSI